MRVRFPSPAPIYGLVISSWRQTARTVPCLISRCRGTGATFPLAEFFQIAWLPPSRARTHPWARRCRSKSSRFTKPRVGVPLGRARNGVLSRLFPVICHYLREGVQEVRLGFLQGLAFGKDLRQLFEVASETALRRRLENGGQLDLQAIQVHGRSFPRRSRLFKCQNSRRLGARFSRASQA